MVYEGYGGIYMYTLHTYVYMYVNMCMLCVHVFVCLYVCASARREFLCLVVLHTIHTDLHTYVSR